MSTPYEKMQIARAIDRVKTEDFIETLITDFVELKGDYVRGEDAAIIGGIGLFHGIPVTVIGHRKGHDLESNVACNFGMPEACGYRKAIRLMKEADKFNRPVITFVDTPGAYPGIAAEENGIASAIAESMAVMSALSVPVITVVTGEGNSGGALAIAVANKVLMLENAVYSILSAEGFASILWKDSSKTEKACNLMKMTAEDLLESGFCDVIVKEPKGGLEFTNEEGIEVVGNAIYKELKALLKKSKEELKTERYEKFRKMGA